MVVRWFGTGKQLPVSSDTGAWNAGRAVRVNVLTGAGGRNWTRSWTGCWASSQSSATSFGTARSFRRRTSWCWNIAPEIPVTDEIHDQIQVDGIYVGSGCCLIAVAGDHVLGWQWCDTEKKAAWAALRGRFPAPTVVITDGGSGIAAALFECWSETAVQRCLVHVQRNVRTYRNGTALVPGWVRANQASWYTHDKLRKAYRLLERLSQAGTLFTYLRTELAGLQIASTTNRIEGGTNAQPRLLLRAHRGMSEEHRKRAIEWYLYLHGEHPLPPAKLIKTSPYRPARTTPAAPTEQKPGPELYSTGLIAEEGLWTRKGWAGRS